jgi:hypothetical protein
MNEKPANMPEEDIYITWYVFIQIGGRYGGPHEPATNAERTTVDVPEPNNGESLQ